MAPKDTVPSEPAAVAQTTSLASSKNNGQSDFWRSYTDEPHATRRKQILAKHPEIEKLFVPDNRVVPVVVLMVLAQLACAYYSQQLTWPVFFVMAWVVGGTITHSLSLMTHELSHNLVFETKSFNVWFGYFCNLGMGLPSCATFKRYHMEHHQYQGADEVDMDLPTQFEGKFFRGLVWKTFFCSFQAFFYAGRPGLVRPKVFNKDEFWNYAIVFSWDAFIMYTFGLAPFLYMIASDLMGMGLHPMAGHFISEHYVFVEGQETYSYYGILNKLTWNVGYHNEHHDFPRVPGWRLPEVKRIAPEFYKDLACYDSWTAVLWNFITDPKITLFSRMRRASRLSKGSRSDDTKCE